MSALASRGGFSTGLTKVSRMEADPPGRTGEGGEIPSPPALLEKGQAPVSEVSPVGQDVRLVCGSIFCVAGDNGDIMPGEGHGLFVRDTRALSCLQLLAQGLPVQALGTRVLAPWQSQHVLLLPWAQEGESPLVGVRTRYLNGGLSDDLEIFNHGSHGAEVELDVLVEADFIDVLTMKLSMGPGKHARAVRSDDGYGLRIRGGPVTTEVRSSVKPAKISRRTLTYRFHLPSGESWKTRVNVTCQGSGEAGTKHIGADVDPARLSKRAAAWRKRLPRLESGWDELDRLYDQGVQDLSLLLMEDVDGTDDLVVAAGMPWFMTLFGRDAILTSLMTLPFDRELGRGVLRALAKRQGRDRNPASDEEPGKILHEIRFGTEWPPGSYNAYYGTVDATPLFVVLVAEAWKWGMPWEEVLQLLPTLRQALYWTITYGDRDGDGFLEYRSNVSGGLRNQGWKDSFDGIQFRDGRLAEGPIALCEVQGYQYMALIEASRLLEAAGDDTAGAIGEEATRLRDRFREEFWMDDVGYPALALDGEKRQVDAIASNAAHLLWTGILDDDQAASVARWLVSDELFSGWGLRTLATSNRGYKPVSYHTGSVWPHDTVIAAGGLARLGFVDEALVLIGGLLAAAPYFSFRLPELFAGFSRQEFPYPVRYPPTCSPQAWAGASSLLVLRVLAGLNADIPKGRASLRPIAPPGAWPWSVEGLQLADGRLSFSVDERGRLCLDEAPAGLEVQGVY